ncbi:MAG: cation transporting ATPase C-terminal domain-containing protein, partial [Clostridia bacterium]|nr:cation transporting ATPase C-terminal domain-containing protein [Clostridia bacterium]
TENDLMQKPPRDPDEGIFAGGIGFRVIYQGVMLGALTLVSYLVGNYMETGAWAFVNSNAGMTMAFLTLSMAEVFHSFNMRSMKRSLFAQRKQNKWLWGAGLLSLVMTTLVIFVPFLANAFGFATTTISEYLVALALAFVVIPIVEIEKLISRIVAKRK